MAKNDNPHALRFLESMEKHGMKEAAENFLGSHLNMMEHIIILFIHSAIALA